MSGKGDVYRPCDKKAFEAGWRTAFGKGTEEQIVRRLDEGDYPSEIRHDYEFLTDDEFNRALDAAEEIRCSRKVQTARVRGE